MTPADHPPLDDTAASEGGAARRPGASVADASPHPSPVVPWVLIVGGIVGIVAATVLTLEKLALLADPNHITSCDFNPIVSCGSIIGTWQASLFGDLPNPVIGLVGFSLVLTSGVAMLAGARLRAWYWWSLLGGVLLAVVFVHWLAYSSLYVIGALCPYCMVVWLTVMCLLSAVLCGMSARRLLPAFVGRWAPTMVVVWTGLIILLIFFRFQAFWETLLP